MRGDTEFGGVQFFDKDGNKILEAGFLGGDSKEFVLQDGERLVGVKSKLYDDERNRPRQEDLVFVIGWMK